jgi:hypothetical protein
MAVHWAADFCRKVVDALTCEQRTEVLTSPAWDNHEFRNMVITHAIELVEGEMFAATAKNETHH